MKLLALFMAFSVTVLVFISFSLWFVHIYSLKKKDKLTNKEKKECVIDISKSLVMLVITWGLLIYTGII